MTAKRTPISEPARLIENHGDLVAERTDLVEQLSHFLRRRAIVERGHQLHRLRHTLQVAFELGLEGVVQHGGSPFL
jgi:hypothetical protein